MGRNYMGFEFLEKSEGSVSTLRSFVPLKAGLVTWRCVQSTLINGQNELDVSTR
jgi:hypothetical protein